MWLVFSQSATLYVYRNSTKALKAAALGASSTNNRRGSLPPPPDPALRVNFSLKTELPAARTNLWARMSSPFTLRITSLRACIPRMLRMAVSAPSLASMPVLAAGESDVLGCDEPGVLSGKLVASVFDRVAAACDKVAANCDNAVAVSATLLAAWDKDAVACDKHEAA